MGAGAAAIHPPGGKGLFTPIGYACARRRMQEAVMAITDFGPGLDHTLTPNRPQAAASAQVAEAVAGDRRTAGFAALVRAADTRVSGPEAVGLDALEARTSARGDIPTEISTRIAEEAREEAEAALAFALRSGDTLRTLIEAKVQHTIDAGLSGGITANADGADTSGGGRTDPHAADWRKPFG